MRPLHFAGVFYWAGRGKANRQLLLVANPEQGMRNGIGAPCNSRMYFKPGNVCG